MPKKIDIEIVIESIVVCTGNFSNWYMAILTVLNINIMRRTPNIVPGRENTKVCMLSSPSSCFFIYPRVRSIANS
jgi:hypothetical protein